MIKLVPSKLSDAGAIIEFLLLHIDHIDHVVMSRDFGDLTPNLDLYCADCHSRFTTQLRDITE